MNNFSKADVGSIIRCRFPTTEGGRMLHYALVIGVDASLHGLRYRAAYGSSKKVSREGHLPHEFLIIDDQELLVAGLTVPTRFDLKRIRTFDSTECAVVGSILYTSEVVERLRLAALEGALL